MYIDWIKVEKKSTHTSTQIFLHRHVFEKLQSRFLCFLNSTLSTCSRPTKMLLKSGNIVTFISNFSEGYYFVKLQEIAYKRHSRFSPTIFIIYLFLNLRKRRTCVHSILPQVNFMESVRILFNNEEFFEGMFPLVLINVIKNI